MSLKDLHSYIKKINHWKILSVDQVRYRSDHGKEFENASFSKFCREYGIFFYI